MIVKRWGWGLLLLAAGLASGSCSKRARVRPDLSALGMAGWSAWRGCAAWHFGHSAGQFERGVSPGEWKAWIGLGFMLVALVYFFANVRAFGAGAASMPHAAAIARNWNRCWWRGSCWRRSSRRWKGRVQEDERDREIEQPTDGGGPWCSW